MRGQISRQTVNCSRNSSSTRGGRHHLGAFVSRSTGRVSRSVGKVNSFRVDGGHLNLHVLVGPAEIKQVDKDDGATHSQCTA